MIPENKKNRYKLLAEKHIGRAFRFHEDFRGGEHRLFVSFGKIKEVEGAPQFVPLPAATFKVETQKFTYGCEIEEKTQPYMEAVKNHFTWYRKEAYKKGRVKEPVQEEKTVISNGPSKSLSLF